MIYSDGSVNVKNPQERKRGKNPSRVSMSMLNVWYVTTQGAETCGRGVSMRQQGSDTCGRGVIACDNRVRRRVAGVLA